MRIEKWLSAKSISITVYQISEHLFYFVGAISDSIHQDIVRSRMTIEGSTG
jgi:hypothetical protein